MLRYRLLYGPALVLALIAVFFVDDRCEHLRLAQTVGQWIGAPGEPRGLVLLIVLAALVVFAVRELCFIFKGMGVGAKPLPVALGALSWMGFLFFVPADAEVTLVVAIAATLLVVTWLSVLVKSVGVGRFEGAVAAAGATVFGLIYLGVLPGFLVLLRRGHSAWVVAAILLVTKSSDIGAYAAGHLVGRHKLIVWLSPGKTWEGLVGGLISSGLAAVLAAWLLNLVQASSMTACVAGVWRGDEFQVATYPLGGAALAGVILGLVGQGGDLVASLLKRDAGLKDSGQVVPGFGGILDVLDSPLLAVPAAYWLLVVSGK